MLDPGGCTNLPDRRIVGRHHRLSTLSEVLMFPTDNGRFRQKTSSKGSRLRIASAWLFGTGAAVFFGLFIPGCWYLLAGTVAGLTWAYLWSR